MTITLKFYRQYDIYSLQLHLKFHIHDVLKILRQNQPCRFEVGSHISPIVVHMKKVVNVSPVLIKDCNQAI